MYALRASAITLVCLFHVSKYRTFSSSWSSFALYQTHELIFLISEYMSNIAKFSLFHRIFASLFIINTFLFVINCVYHIFCIRLQHHTLKIVMHFSVVSVSIQASEPFGNIWQFSTLILTCIFNLLHNTFLIPLNSLLALSTYILTSCGAFESIFFRATQVYCVCYSF